MSSISWIKDLIATYRLYGRTIDSDVTELWRSDLACYSPEQIMDGLRRYRADRSMERAPAIGQIIALIERTTDDGRPSADEAWAIIKPLIRDESLSAIVTREMQDGYAAAWNLGRDEIGARRAFIDTYNRSVEACRAVRQAVQWVIWPGYNKDMLAQMVQIGLADGRLKRGDVQHLLPAPTADHLQITDLVRENIDRTDLGLTALPDLSSLESQREKALRRMDEIKAELAAAQQKARKETVRTSPLEAAGIHDVVTEQSILKLQSAPKLWRDIAEAQARGEDPEEIIDAFSKKVFGRKISLPKKEAA